MKYPKLLTILMLSLSLFAYSQPKILPSAFRSDIKRLIEDYPRQFASIRGAVLEEKPQTVEYACLIQPAEVNESVIVEYSTHHKPVFSWEGMILRTEEFEVARDKYKWLFYQLKGMNVRYVADNYTLEGQYEAPKETLKFATSTLSLSYPPDVLRKLKIEVTMEYAFPEWNIRLLIYEKQREDADMPEQIEK